MSGATAPRRGKEPRDGHRLRSPGPSRESHPRRATHVHVALRRAPRRVRRLARAADRRQQAGRRRVRRKPRTARPRGEGLVRGRDRRSDASTERRPAERSGREDQDAPGRAGGAAPLHHQGEARARAALRPRERRASRQPAVPLREGRRIHEPDGARRRAARPVHGLRLWRRARRRRDRHVRAVGAPWPRSRRPAAARVRRRVLVDRDRSDARFRLQRSLPRRRSGGPTPGAS